VKTSTAASLSRPNASMLSTTMPVIASLTGVPLPMASRQP